MKKCISLMVLLFGLVHAQAFPCESLFTNYPVPKIPLSSMEVNTTMNMTMGGQAMDTTMYQVVDYTNRRLYQETQAMGMNTLMRYVDGKASMSMKMGEEMMNVPMPPEGMQALEMVFDQGYAQGLPTNFTVISCDGQQSYASMLSGEQVTISTNIPGMEPVVSKMLFAGGRVVGSVSTIPGQGEMLMTFDEMAMNTDNIPEYIKMSMYQLTADTASPVGVISINVLSYNQPVDEALFAE
jgi:hypothetical protein